MKACMMRRGWDVVSLSLLLAAAVAVGSVSGQGQTPDKSSGKVDKKVSGRLPAYYGEVVSKEQRAKIYEIQAKYAEQVTKLREQMDMLEKKQLADVEAVLTPEQRDLVAKRIADAKAKRAKTEPSPTEAGTKSE